ncbi:MAG: hypothetical protein UY96_C0017G0063 [Parcubacteria group bacterium GW2011_GWB1_56_8]|nr:MAG: hypothetical protein UY96_C0017G0063 [Parcubacteria group bacterium GW2011_GWB1_56_8]
MTERAHKFLAPELLEEAVEQVAAIAKHERVRVALIGGFALQLYGSTRLTGDVDFASDVRLDALPPGPSLSFGGEQTQAPNGVPVDIVLRDDKYAELYDEALAQAIHQRGVPVPVARPEHLAAMKMVAGRARDDADLEFLVASGVVDVKKALAVIKEHLGSYAEDEFGELVEEILWKAGRGRL